MSFWGSDIWAETPRWDSTSPLHRFRNNIPSSSYITQASSLISLSYSLSEKWGLYSIYLIKVLGNELFFVKYIKQCQKYYKIFNKCWKTFDNAWNFTKNKQRQIENLATLYTIYPHWQCSNKWKSFGFVHCTHLKSFYLK